MTAIERRPEAHIVVHPGLSRYHDQFLEAFERTLPGIRRSEIRTGQFADQTPWFRVIDDGERGVCAIVPLWFVHPFDKSLFRAQEIGSALTHTERGRPPLAEKVIAVYPYSELRGDGDPFDHEAGAYVEGGAIYAEVLAKTLAASHYSAAVFWELHSGNAARYLKMSKMPYLALTAAPLYRQWLEDRGLVTPNSNIVALDKGALQRCLYLAELLGLDPGTNLVAFEKSRRGRNVVSHETRIYGHPEGKNGIIFDDLIDTAGSLTACGYGLKELGCGEVIVVATHGVLSGPARKNIEECLRGGIISRVVLTDSRPEAAEQLVGIEGVDIISSAPILAGFAQALAVSSIDEVRRNLLLAPYILEPREKEMVWSDLQEEFGEALPSQSRSLHTVGSGQVVFAQ